MKRRRHLAKHVTSAKVVDLMNRVEPQPVDVIFGQPVQRIVDEESSYSIALRAVEIDRRAPRRAIAIGEEPAILAEVITFRTEMVVNDVEHDRESLAMACVDEPLESERPAIRCMRRVKIGAVIAPVASAGKRDDRHDLQSGYAQLEQIWQPIN